MKYAQSRADSGHAEKNTLENVNLSGFPAFQVR
jgi:hypothetical protein